jgi:hypothetical protein
MSSLRTPNAPALRFGSHGPKKKARVGSGQSREERPRRAARPIAWLPMFLILTGQLPSPAIRSRNVTEVGICPRSPGTGREQRNVTCSGEIGSRNKSDLGQHRCSSSAKQPGMIAGRKSLPELNRPIQKTRSRKRSSRTRKPFFPRRWICLTVQRRVCCELFWTKFVPRSQGPRPPSAPTSHPNFWSAPDMGNSR